MKLDFDKPVHFIIYWLNRLTIIAYFSCSILYITSAFLAFISVPTWLRESINFLNIYSIIWALFPAIIGSVLSMILNLRFGQLTKRQIKRHLIGFSITTVLLGGLFGANYINRVSDPSKTSATLDR